MVILVRAPGPSSWVPPSFMKFDNKKRFDSCLVGQKTAIETVSEADTRRENGHKKMIWLEGRKEKRVNRNSKLGRTDFFFWNNF